MITLSKIKENNLPVIGATRCGDYEYIAKFDNRFPDDKICYKSDDYVLLLDGLVLNRSQILKGRNKTNWAECVLDLYLEKGEKFFMNLEGSYVGALYDVKKDKWVVFKDHLGSFPVFYANTGQLFVSTDIACLYRMMKQSGITLNLDPIGIKMLFFCDLSIDGYTICQEVKWLHPGCYLVYENGQIAEKQFYEITRNEIHLSSEDEYLDMIDESFCDAIKKQFSKDSEYGYKTITLLSGGIDSRIMVWISHQMGWNKQLNVTFANSGSYDETIARQIAMDLGHEWLFKPLEDANFMYLVDDCSMITGGNMVFSRMAHMRSMTSLINYEGANFGVMHSGTKGEFLKGDEAAGGHNGSSNYYMDFLKKNHVKPSIEYDDPEVFTIYSRELFNKWGIDQSPFMELGFFETTMRIPNQLRLTEYIYKQWICKRHPDANKYAWATTGLPYGSKRFNPQIPILNCYLHQLPNYLGYKMGRHGFGMNPYSKFYNNNNIGLRSFYDSYAQYLVAIADEGIRTEIKSSLESDNIYRKFRAVTILSAIKLFFS